MLIYWESKDDSVLSNIESYEQVTKQLHLNHSVVLGLLILPQLSLTRHWSVMVIDVMIIMLSGHIKMTIMHNSLGHSPHSLFTSHLPHPQRNQCIVTSEYKAHVLSEFLTVTNMQNHGIYEDYEHQTETQNEKNSWKLSQSFSFFTSQ